MAENIHIQTEYMHHSTGTKFYEVVQLWNVDAKKFIVIKRWGKVEQGPACDGGQVKVETYTRQTLAQDAANKILIEKHKGKNGENYFDVKAPNMGLHGRSSDPDLGELGEYLKDHYGITRAQHLWQLLGIESVSLAGEIKLPGSEFGVPIKPPKPEPVRSEDWGSW